MTPEAPTRGGRRGIRRWFRILPVALPVAALLLTNLWLACPPARHWIAGKIQRRTGLETRVGGASIWPWNGMCLRDVDIYQPPPLRAAVREPLVHIDKIRLSPVWSAWLHGKRDLQSVDLVSPRLVLPVELLVDLAKSQMPPPPAAPPGVAATPPMVGPPAPTPAVPVAPPVASAAPDTPPEAPAITLPPTVWLRIDNASLTLCSAVSGKSWLEVSELSGSIPVAGSPARSTLHLRSIHAAGMELLTDLSASLDWTSPLLSLEPVETEIHGFKVQLGAKLGMLGGLPLQIDAQVPKQPLPLTSLPSDSRAEAEAIAANARFRGLLLAPGTWQGDLVTEALAPAGRLAGHDAKFERGSAVTVLRGGTLSCIDARLIGDDLSLLGNATLLADGRLAANLRMVAPPENASAIAGRVFPGVGEPRPLTPLSTPQRAAFDLEAIGNIGQLFLRLGRNGPVIEINR